MEQVVSQDARVDQFDDEGEISLLDLWRTVAANWRILVAGPLLAGLLALGVTFLIPPTYTASTNFLPPQQQQSAAASMLQSLGALGGLAGAAAGIKSPAEQYVAFLKSRSVQDALVSKFKLKERYEAKLQIDALDQLNGHTRIASGKDGLISIEVDDKVPAFAAQLANAYVDELGKLLDRLAVTDAQQRRHFFEKQLTDAKNKLIVAEQALKATGVNSSALKANPTAAVAEVAQLQAQITAQEVKLASMRGYLTESAPAFKQAQAELNALRAQGDKVARPGSVSGENDADYIARYRDMKYYETLFDLFAKQFELAKIDEAREGPMIQVLDVAAPPERRSKPKKLLICLLTAIFSEVVFFVFIFARHTTEKN